MTNTITMLAPTASQKFDGNSQPYQADANGLIHNVNPVDIAALERAGCIVQVSGGGGGGGSSSSTMPATPLTASSVIPPAGGSFDLRLTAAAALQLPQQPADGTVVTFKDALQNCQTFNATILPGTGDTIDLQAQIVMNQNGQQRGLRYVLAAHNWDIF